MDSDLSRQVAEAMQLTRCPSRDNRRGSGYHGGPCTATYEWPCNRPYFNLADARDRDAAIAWLVAKGWTVRLDHGPDGHTVIIWTDTDLGTRGAYPRPTIEEAFGWAFLEAMGVQG